MGEDIQKIAEGLTKAQRRWMGPLTCWEQPAPHHPPRWMTFPPKNTHDVLCRYGLVDRAGQLRETGLQVRAYLKGQQS